MGATVRNPKVHVNLRKLSQKIMADKARDRPEWAFRVLAETNEEMLTRIEDVLRQDRLGITDAEFRSRYARWL